MVKRAESLAAAFHIGVGRRVTTKALQVVMSEGRTPGRHDGRDAEVRRFTPFPLHGHSFFAITIKNPLC